MALTDIAIKKAQPKEKPYMIKDDRGLYLEVMPRGSKLWRFRYWIKGKEKRKSFGKYPSISLKEARDRREKARIDLDHGVDPFSHKGPIGATFKTISLEWFEKKIQLVRTERHAETVIARLRKYLFPFIGDRALKDITAPEILEVVRKIEKLGHYETAHRTLQICGQVFRYAVATGRAERDVTADLKGALAPVRSKHHATITDPVKIGELLRAIDSLDSVVVRSAMKIAAYCFVRPGELRHAEWTELDLKKAEWRIPAEKMKMRRIHIVPLSDQAVKVFQELKPMTGHCKWVFPSIRTWERPMSENTVTAALRRLGYASGEMTGHGFRSMASTLLNEQGWPVDAIERQLAHVEGNSVRAAYNYAEHMDVRRKMVQHWADWLEDRIKDNKR